MKYFLPIQKYHKHMTLIVPDAFSAVGILFGILFFFKTTQCNANGAMSWVDIEKQILSQNAQIKESEADVEIARGQLAEARAALFPRASALALAAPIFEERGNTLASNSNWNKWGPYVRVGGEIIQPLYTFGQISAYGKAATAQVEARSHQVSMKKQEVLLKAKEFYFGYLMASDFETLVDELVSFLDEASATAEKEVKKKRGTVKKHDIYRLNTALDELKQKKLFATAGKQTALRALSWISGTQILQITIRALPIPTYEKKTLLDLQNQAILVRPELKALHEGQRARENLASAKASQSLPVLFVGGFASYAWSPVRDKQNSTFANDNFNHLQGGAGIGLKFDLEFLRHAAEAAGQRAEAMKLKATEEYAKPGILLQTEKAFLEVEVAEKGYEIAKHRLELSKKWFISSAMGFSIGITPAKDLLEALEGNGLSRKNYIETLYGWNMAVAQLKYAVGGN